MNDPPLISILSSRDSGGKGFVPVRFGLFLKIKSPLERIVVAQVIAAVIATGISLIVGLVAAYSALLGGLVCIVPGYIAVRMLAARKEGVTVATDTGLQPVIYSELVRLALSIVLFIAVFILVETLDVRFFFGAFIGLQLFYIAVPAVEANRLRRAMAVKNSD